MTTFGIAPIGTDLSDTEAWTEIGTAAPDFASVPTALIGAEVLDELSGSIRTMTLAIERVDWGFLALLFGKPPSLKTETPERSAMHAEYRRKTRRRNRNRG